MAYLMTRCDFCNSPIDEGGRATQTNGWCSKHIHLTNSIKPTAGKEPKRFKIGGSLTVEGKYVPVDHSKTIICKGYPEGFISFRGFCKKRGKDDRYPDHTAFLKLLECGDATYLGEERVVRENAEWPHGRSSRIWQPKTKVRRSKA